MVTLTQEQARVLAESAEPPPRVVDPQTQHIYFLVSGMSPGRKRDIVLFQRDQD